LVKQVHRDEGRVGTRVGLACLPDADQAGVERVVQNSGDTVAAEDAAAAVAKASGAQFGCERINRKAPGSIKLERVAY
jgi:hypothetical protein